MISIALIEYSRLVSDGISLLLNRHPDLRVVSNGGRDMSQLGDVEPHVVLLDVSAANGGSLRVAERVRTVYPGAKVIAMDLRSAQHDLVDWVHAGVSGFITKDATLDDVVRTIRSVMKGTKVLPPEMIDALFSEITEGAVEQSTGGAATDAPPLTAREAQVVALISEGLSNKAIAGRLHIATHTVKSHVRNIMKKLTLRTRLQIAAYTHGLRRNSHQPTDD
jgi:DNA-binding NarL/FixJ family response regulator